VTKGFFDIAKRDQQKKPKKPAAPRYRIEMTMRRGLLVVDLRQVFLSERNEARLLELLQTLCARYPVERALWSQRPGQAYAAGGGWYWFICHPQDQQQWLTPIQRLLDEALR
jgi:hypothetical protein